jgi:cellulose synthase/poly-beta-1,6-N-acetylglucosamine synthase-like glycosyltransferase
MVLLLAISAGVLLYIYGGYPLLLKAIVWLRGPRRIARADITPSMSVVISAYNEAAVIARKLENTLSLDYPRDALEVVVVSDASNDGTDDIVRRFAHRGVVLARMEQRRGKTAGLNRAIPTLRGDVVVFSDANALYERDALRKLARNFADPDVGCVTGEARYMPGGKAAADLGERAYWGYEMRIKRLETAVGSMVGGDGAIYAIRRTLWSTLPEDAINDFLNPLQIVTGGWRAVYESEAICYEETGGGIGVEYRRRVRIVSRSWRAIFQARHALNPRRVGIFAWQVVSHKILRWFTGLFVLLAVAGALGVVSAVVPVAALAGAALLLGVCALVFPAARRVALLTAYFATINVASVVGLFKGTLGRVSATWATPREAASPVVRARKPAVVPVGTLFLAATTAALAMVSAMLAVSEWAVAVVFWVCAGTLAYVYAGYPLILHLLRMVARAPVRQGDAQPRVSLLIAANDEAGVMDAKLHNALLLDYPEDLLDIVVASDGSVDGTNDIVRRFAPRVRLIEFSPRRGKIAALTAAMQSISSDVVVFSDANTFLERRAIRALVRNFADERVGGVSGDVTLVGHRAALAASEDLYYQYEHWVQRAESEIGSMIGADGALYAIRRELFVPPPPDTILDDMAIPMAIVRSGYRVVFDPEACAREEGSTTATEEFARKTRVIAGAVQFLKRPDSRVPADAAQVILSLVSHKALRWMSPVFATGAFVTSVVLSGSAHEYAAAAIAQGALLLCGLAGCAPAMRRNAVVAVAHYFCLVQAAALIGFLRGVTGRQSVLWRRYVRMAAPQVAQVHR